MLRTSRADGELFLREGEQEYVIVIMIIITIATGLTLDPMLLMFRTATRGSNYYYYYYYYHL